MSREGYLAEKFFAKVCIDAAECIRGGKFQAVDDGRTVRQQAGDRGNGAGEKKRRMAGRPCGVRVPADGAGPYSARTRSSNRMSTPKTPAMSPASVAMGAETVMQRAPVIFEV